MPGKETTVDKELALQFFQCLKDDYDKIGGLRDEAEAMLAKEPKLLDCKCPETDNDSGLSSWVGYTAAECMCDPSICSAGSRDTLRELVEAGAMATGVCYDIIHEDGITMHDYIEVLLMSGHMPLKRKVRCRDVFFLDFVANSCDGEPLDILDGVMRILHRQVRAGDNFNFGEMQEHMIKKMEGLPKLEVGVTHEEGGPFALFQREWFEWLKKRDDRNGKDSEAKEVEVEVSSKHPKKKQRRTVST